MKPPSVLVEPSSKLIPPSSASVTANAIASHSFPRLPGSADDIDGKEKLEKFSDLWTNSKVLVGLLTILFKIYIFGC